MLECTRVVFLDPCYFLYIKIIFQSSVRRFADDTTVFVIVDDIEEATLTQNGDLNALKFGADQWLVSFNPQKNKSLYISNKTDLVVPPLYFDGLMIGMVGIGMVKLLNCDNRAKLSTSLLK